MTGTVGDDPCVRAEVPIGPPPRWAVLQRQLFRVLDQAWRRFSDTVTLADGRLRFPGTLPGRDGVDDLYEPFASWPLLSMLGGGPDILEAAKHHWEGVTRQLTELGMLTDEYERGYDWFHQGESNLLFYGLCAADPDDDRIRARALRFAQLYLPGSATGNVDPEHAILRAPHTGADGPRYGLEDVLEQYGSGPGFAGMAPYGLPLHDLDGITTWADLADPSNARRMADAMQERLGHGDVAVNLAMTSLLANAWLYDHDPAIADWLHRYVDGWLTRCREYGVLPDNVGPSGMVGELHDGRWWGGHYGWGWPHGVYSVGAAALLGAANAHLTGAPADVFELARSCQDVVLEHARRGPLDAAASMAPGWFGRLGDDAAADLLLVPYRHGPRGWFDHHPLPPSFPVTLWWHTHDPRDRVRVDLLAEASGYDWHPVRPFREKEEGGHEPPWDRYLAGTNPEFPERILELAHWQVADRLDRLERDPLPDFSVPSTDIHWWQDHQPVVTEALLLTTTGSPQPLYNGGLPRLHLRYGDARRGTAGLPPDVAALVSSIDPEATVVELVNLSMVDLRDVIVRSGGYGEHRMRRIRWETPVDGPPPPAYHMQLPGTHMQELEVDTDQLVVTMPPRTRVRLQLTLELHAQRPRHRSFRTSAPTP